MRKTFLKPDSEKDVSYFLQPILIFMIYNLNYLLYNWGALENYLRAQEFSQLSGVSGVCLGHEDPDMSYKNLREGYQVKYLL